MRIYAKPLVRFVLVPGLLIGFFTAFAAGAQETADIHLPATDDFREHCAVCHGIGAEGDGPMTLMLIRKPPDLTRLAARQEGIFPRDYISFVIEGRGDFLAHGPREMPIWGFEFGGDMRGPLPRDVSAQIGRLVDYLESIQQD